MKLRTALIKEVSLVSACSIITLLLLTVLIFSVTVNLTATISESQVPLTSLQKMLEISYANNGALLDYLTTSALSVAPDIDILTNLQDYNISSANANSQQAYFDAQLAFAEVQQLKREIIMLHTQELAGDNVSDKKSVRIIMHSEAFVHSVTAITSAIQLMTTQNILLQEKINQWNTLYYICLFTIIVAFSFYLVFRIYQIAATIIRPIDDTIDVMQKFVEGDYASRVKPATITEIKELQENLNNVLHVIQTTAHEKPAQVESQLLSNNYVLLLDILRQAELEKKALTFTGIRKRLQITYPTVHSRLSYLESRGYLTITKEGRDKLVRLTSKGRDL